MTTLKSVSLSQLRGLTSDEVRALDKLGLKTTAALVKAAPDTHREQALAKRAGIPLARMREAVNRADLVQLKGMGPAKADLFENAGVNSVKELAQRRPDALVKALTKYVDSRPELNYRLPDAKTVAVLVQRAKALYATPLTSLDQAKDAAANALTEYVNEALFSDDPRGASFRSEMADGNDRSKWPAMKAAMLAEIPAWLGRAPSPMGNSGPEDFPADATGYWVMGRFDGLHTEVHVRKADGEVDHLLVEVD